MINKTNKAALLAALLVPIAATPALCDIWSYRPGLWAEDYSGEFAKSNAFSATQFCIATDTVTLVMPAPDQPLRYKSEICKEIVVSKSRTGREVQKACGPSGIIREQHHVVVTGKMEEVDREEVKDGSPGNFLIKKFRWVGAKCGMAPIRSGDSITAK